MLTLTEGGVARHSTGPDHGHAHTRGIYTPGLPHTRGGSIVLMLTKDQTMAMYCTVVHGM